MAWMICALVDVNVIDWPAVPNIRRSSLLGTGALQDKTYTEAETSVKIFNWHTSCTSACTAYLVLLSAVND